MSVRRSLALSFLEKYASLVIQLGSGLIIARLITPEAFGTFAIAYAVVGFAHVIREMGVSSYLIQLPELEDHHIRAALFATGVVAWSLGLVLFLGSPLVGRLYGEEVRHTTLILLLSFLIMPLSSTIMATLQREMDFAALLRINLVATLANAAVGILLAAQGVGAAGLAWGSVAGQATITLLAAAHRPLRAHFLPSFVGLREVVRFGSPLVASNILLQISGSVANLITAWFATLQTMGFFMRAQSVTDLFSRLIMNAVQPVLLPMFSTEHRLGHDLGQAYWRTMRLVSAVTWPFFLFCATHSEEIVVVLFGDPWRSAGPLLQCMSIGGMFWFVGYIAVPLLTAAGRLGAICVGQGINQAIAIIGVMCAAPYGVDTVAKAAIVISAAHAAVWLLVVQSLIRCPGSFWVINLFREAIFLTALALLSLATLLLGHDGGHMLSLIVGLFLLIVGWLAIIIITSHPASIELQRIWRVAYPTIGLAQKIS